MRIEKEMVSKPEPLSSLKGFFTGEVVETNDPEGLDRIKVKIYNAMGDEILPWAKICTPYKQFHLPADKGDNVIIIFEKEDINKPLILGFLFSRTNLPPSTERDKKYLKSKKNLKIVLDDGVNKMQLSGDSSVLKQAARKGDSAQCDVVSDASFIGWISAIHVFMAAIVALGVSTPVPFAPLGAIASAFLSSYPTPPPTISSKITSGSSQIEIGD